MEDAGNWATTKPGVQGHRRHGDKPDSTGYSDDDDSNHGDPNSVDIEAVESSAADDGNHGDPNSVDTEAVESSDDQAYHASQSGETSSDR
ncbi:hypothetical protein PF001_g4545 [Phytophthora fragariae]|uniref:Uncharacterized protein n=1 Tax=Phytophthora fragariae TaxID=53985 RepID=A0A6A4EFH8_9STRA|nr:hypothetical protein PF006_g3080 [Phytophthora fragariae]KAE9322164.1 hypothetical protein PF001_g4545 [Phytophthora fragariae]